jgi:hypothetical protein
MSKGSTLIIALLLIVIGLLVWLLIVKQSQAPSVPGDQTSITDTPTGTITPTPTPSTTKPLHARIVVTYPKAGASVPKTFTVTGKAPGNWFNEAQAPLMVQAEDGSKIGTGQMQAQGDWMTTNLVDFKADVTIDMAYSGKATLVLLKDNESGLPQNDDSLEIPINVQ